VNEECSVYKATELMGKKWTLLILLELFKGESKWKRYSVLKRALPDITPKVLSQRLRELAREGVILKKMDASSFPVKSSYCLSKSGLDFVEIIMDVKRWSLKWKSKNFVCKKTECKTCLK
jgi:DNA-binding HxlR family transcriptional regulator